MKQLSPQVTFEDLTLEDLIQSPLYTLQITNTDVAKHTRIVGGDRVSYITACILRPLNTAVMPEYDTIPRVNTSQLSLAGRDPTVGIHGRYFLPDIGNIYFKPRESGREGEFDRELRILNDIKRKDLVSEGEIRLSSCEESRGNVLVCCTANSNWLNWRSASLGMLEARRRGIQ